MAKRIQWFAGSDDILRMGPFKSDVEAWRALRVSKRLVSIDLTEASNVGPPRMRTGPDRIHAKGAYVWPEEVGAK